MIYRISIGMNIGTEWIHDHYASPEEMHDLRISPTTGEVERAFLYHGPQGDAKISWVNMKDTCVVELGEVNKRSRNPYYDGDIVAKDGVRYKVISHLITLISPVSEEVMGALHHITEFNGETDVVTGNIKENPDLALPEPRPKGDPIYWAEHLAGFERGKYEQE